MNKYLVGFVALAAFLSVELIGATQADAQGRLFSRMRGRSARTQCCQVTYTTNNCGSATMVATPVSCAQPIVASPAVASDASCGECCGTAVVSTCSACCQRRGRIARASCVTPVCGQVVQCGCVGCETATGAVVEGCVGGACGGTIIEGTIIEGEVIEGEVIEGSEIKAPVESSIVPDPPAEAPEPSPSDADKPV